MDKIVKRPLLSDARKHDLLNQQKRLPNRIKVDHFLSIPYFSGVMSPKWPSIFLAHGKKMVIRKELEN